MVDDADEMKMIARVVCFGRKLMFMYIAHIFSPHSRHSKKKKLARNEKRLAKRKKVISISSIKYNVHRM